MSATDHAVVEELLGAYALDALDADEREDVERHVARCPRCAAEVRDHLATAGLLGSVGEPPPEGLWERIAGSLEAPPPVVPFPLHRTRPREPRSARVLVGGIGVAAALVVGLLTWRLVDQQQQLDDLDREVALGSEEATVAALLTEPTSEVMTLRDDGGRDIARAVVGEEGEGFLLGSPLPDLAPGRTYQLWALSGGRAVSLGVLGPEPGITSFHLGPSADELAVTDEPDGGSVTPEGRLIAEAQFA